MHLQIAIYKVLYERTNITASFVEHLKFQEKKDFYSTLGWETRARRLHTLKLLYKCKRNIQSRSSYSEVPLKIGVWILFSNEVN